MENPCKEVSGGKYISIGTKFSSSRRKYFKSSAVLIVRFYDDLCINMLKGEHKFGYFKTESPDTLNTMNYEIITREEFKLELALRKTSIWRAINGIEDSLVSSSEGGTNE